MNNGLVLDHGLMVNQEDVGKLRPYVGGTIYFRLDKPKSNF